MQRRRTVAAGPVRTALQAWEAVVALFTVTLARAPAIDQDQVRQSLARLAGVGPMLVGPHHLEKRDLVLVAGPLELAVNIVSGTEALSLDENLNEVPGAATAVDWDLWLPEVDPLVAWLERAVQGDRRLHVGQPDQGGVDKANGNASTKRYGEVDLEAFRRLEDQ